VLRLPPMAPCTPWMDVRTPTGHEPMADAALSVAELEAQYPLYCKAMRILVRDGVTINKARRTVCWQRLELLHRSLPRQYREPEQLYLHLSRDPTLLAQIRAGT
jgi:hypothetical protein